MATELEITKRQFYSDYHNYYNVEKTAIEDCRFLTFTELLDEADIFISPILARKKGTFKNGSWSLLGYSCESYRQIEEEEEEDEEENDEDGKEQSTDDNSLEFNWEYTIFNGFFSEDIEITRATKVEINKAIKETVRYIEKTFSDNIINDICEARDLQDQLLDHQRKDVLERLDICIVTDSIIDQENLETSINITNTNLQCKIYYWDLKKWNDLKRSKSKRVPINIDFHNKEFKLYDINFLEKKANNNLTYYLSAFPGNLIADLYDYHNTRLLENNVRVFLSANRKANKAIRNTIKTDPIKFFSYNNGISATAESVVIENGKIKKINDFQIVNGGQTTASIHYARKKDRENLENVFVAVKITSLKKDKEYAQTVSNISKAANTQSAIRSSDFHANDTMLIEIERFSLKIPAQNREGRNIYYFFERMSGQYNVTKNSRGTNKNQRIWEGGHPKIFSYNKIDIARWYNCMELLPHIAALSAEKQFTNFMEEKNFKRKEITVSRYKTLIGYGLVFSRIRKLCGTKNSKVYPSIIGDSSVGMATTIYAMSYLHYLTEGCLNYWQIYDFKYDLCETLQSKERNITPLDKILIKIIKECWKQIAIFGGTSAQEQTKKQACWEFVKSNISLDKGLKSELKPFLIPLNEKEKRETLEFNDEDSNYFEALHILLSNNGKVLHHLMMISQNQSEYRNVKIKISNQIKRIKSLDKIMTKQRIHEIYLFYLKLKSEGFSFNEKVEENDLSVNIKIDRIFGLIFKDKKYFFKDLEDYIIDNEDNFDKNEMMYNKIQEIVEKYDREYGLSINDFLFLEQFMVSYNSERIEI